MSVIDEQPGNGPFVDEIRSLYNARLPLLESTKSEIVNILRTLVRQRTDGNPLELQRRIRVQDGRIKDVERLILKAQDPRYLGKIVTAEDVFGVITDIVGLRIVCNNPSDIALVRQWLIDSADLNICTFLGGKADENYLLEPKPSGYRAHHLLIQLVDGGAPVVCELQMRTLLQEAWGELLHEDTYKPGVPLPPLARVLAKLMADSLAAMDLAAEEIRSQIVAQIENASPRLEQEQEDLLEADSSILLESFDPGLLNPGSAVWGTVLWIRGKQSEISTVTGARVLIQNLDASPANAKSHLAPGDTVQVVVTKRSPDSGVLFGTLL